jgi:ribosomal protein L11 methyltransferase
MLRCGVPYRIDLDNAPADAFDRLVELGALDVESVDGSVAAILPDDVSVARAAAALALETEAVRLSQAYGRDGASVWVLRPRPVLVGRFQIVPADWPASSGALRMIDGVAFGTGLHATTMLCLEVLDEELAASQPGSVLDVGTGSGVLALAALLAGVPRAVAVDIDADALRAATENARANDMSSRVQVVHGDVDAVSGAWPLVLANILAAPLIEMAPLLARRVGHSGRLVLSGIRSSLAVDVERAYRHLGLRHVATRTRDGWSALIFRASW